MQKSFTYFAIIGGMRTGSSLLERCISQFKSVQIHGELFNPSFISSESKESYLGMDQAQRDMRPVGLIAAMIASNPKLLHGFRIFHDHDPKIIDNILTDRNCGKIILERDILDSFLSVKNAIQTDVWKVGNESDQIHGKIIFDPVEFNNFSQANAEFSRKIHYKLQFSGNTAFWLHYDEIKNIQVLNGIARYLGIDEKLLSLRQPLKRQNPGSAASKVENPLDLPSWAQRSNIGYRAAITPAVVSHLIVTPNLPLLFAPIFPKSSSKIVTWMNTFNIDPASGKAVLAQTGLDRTTFAQWRDKHKSPIVFSVIRHPIVHAYETFNTYRQADIPERDARIRFELNRRFGVAFPSLQTSDIEIVRGAFHKFLEFLELNLNYNTSLRTESAWASQSSLVDGFAKILPASHLIKEGNWVAASEYLAKLVGVEQSAHELIAETHPPHALLPLVTSETELLARNAYGADYERFGWQDLL